MNRLTSRIKPLAAAAVLGLFTLEASAQTTLPWTTTFPPTSITGRERVFTGTDGTLSYMYGGQSGASSAGLDELYSWDGTDLTLLTASGTGPGPRAGGASGYDTSRGKFVVFGGRDFAAGVNLADTWEWDATNGWVQVTTATSPSGRWLIGDTCSYVPGTGLVFHGGNDGTQSSETWAYDGTNWTLLSSSGPALQVACMAYRPNSGDMILYGGAGASGPSYDTWNFDLGTATWTQIATATTPTNPNNPGNPQMVGPLTYFNPVRNRVVMYGGGGGTASHLTWEFDGTDWTDMTDASQLSSENCRNGMAWWVSGSSSAVVICGNRANGTNFDFVLEHGPWTPTGPGTNYCSVNANSTGGPALISGSGSSSIAANDLTLSASPVPIQPFLFFHGPNQLEVPFGNGFLCTGGGIVRLNPPQLAAGQTATRMIDVPLEIGSTGVRNFQCWFRDPAAGGAAYNTSDGYSITFLP